MNCGIIKVSKQLLGTPVESGLSLYKVDTAIWDHILNEAVCILHTTNKFRKVMNPHIFTTATGE